MSRKAVAAIIGTGLLLLVLVLGYLWLTVWGRFDATIYASGFTDSKFRLVSKGMSKAEVQNILGKPLTNVEGVSDDQNRWFYAYLDRAKIPNDDRVTNTWFKVREVDFDKSGRVEETLSSMEQFE